MVHAPVVVVAFSQPPRDREMIAAYSLEDELFGHAHGAFTGLYQCARDSWRPY